MFFICKYATLLEFYHTHPHSPKPVYAEASHKRSINNTHAHVSHAIKFKKIRVLTSKRFEVKYSRKRKPKVYMPVLFLAPIYYPIFKTRLRFLLSSIAMCIHCTVYCTISKNSCFSMQRRFPLRRFSTNTSGCRLSMSKRVGLEKTSTFRLENTCKNFQAY